MKENEMKEKIKEILNELSLCEREGRTDSGDYIQAYQELVDNTEAYAEGIKYEAEETIAGLMEGAE